MSNRTIISFAWASWAISAALAGFVAISAARSATAGADARFPFEEFTLAVTFPTVGTLIATRRPRNPIGWIFCAIGLSHALSIFSPYGILLLASADADAIPFAGRLAWIAVWPWWAPGFGLLAFLFLLFPNGRMLSPRWSWLGWLASVGMVMLVLPQVIFSWNFTIPQLLDISSSMESTSVGHIANMIVIAGLVLLLISAFTATISLIQRLRHAVGIERQQLKWFAYACAVFIVARLIILVFFGDHPEMPLAIALGVLTIAGIPLAVGIAILRYHLYDIDIIIRRTLVYSILSLTLGLVYVGSIVLLQQLVAPLTGGSELAIVASTLVIAALFNPLRKRIQNLIDRRFYRRKYDAAKVLAAFGATARDETDLEQLTAEMLRVVDETMQPEFVGLWLGEPSVDKQRGAM
jgi:hypothetical protein